MTQKILKCVVVRFFFANPYRPVIPLKSRSDSGVMQSGPPERAIRYGRESIKGKLVNVETSLTTLKTFIFSLERYYFMQSNKKNYLC